MWAERFGMGQREETHSGREACGRALAKERFAEKVFAEKAILVSGDAKELNEAQRIGMAALCYLMPGDGRTQRNEAAAGRWK